MRKRDKSVVNSIPVPSTRDAERLILAELVQNPEQIPLARTILTAQFFSVEEYRDLWAILGEMFDQGRTIDLLTIAERIGNTAAADLATVYPGTGSPLSVTDHCTALKNAAIRRKLFISSIQMLEATGDNSQSISDLTSMLGRQMDELIEDAQTGTGAKSITDVLNRLAESIEADQRQRQSGKLSRVPTGFRDLDKFLYSGFSAGNLVILAARPSVGKTAIMLHMAKAAASCKVPVTIYSLEMTSEELCQRLLFSTGYVKPVQMSQGPADWNAIERGNGELSSLPIFLNDQARTMDDITTDIMSNHQRGRCGIAFIDYLGLIQSDNSKQLLYQVIAERTGRLKQLAKQCRIPIVLLCQLNRNIEAENRPPRLDDLRDSGAIEQDADIVLMLERQSRTLRDRNLFMWLRKHRNGKAGNIRFNLEANETFTDFYERTSVPVEV